MPTIVARFEIPYTQLLNPNGELCGPLPEFAHDTAEQRPCPENSETCGYRWKASTIQWLDAVDRSGLAGRSGLVAGRSGLVAGRSGAAGFQFGSYIQDLRRTD